MANGKVWEIVGQGTRNVSFSVEDLGNGGGGGGDVGCRMIQCAKLGALFQLCVFLKK